MKKFLSIFALILIGAIVLAGCEVKFQLPWEIIDDDDEVEECLEGEEGCDEDEVEDDDDSDEDEDDDDGDENGDLISFYDEAQSIYYGDFFKGAHLKVLKTAFGDGTNFDEWVMEGDDIQEWLQPKIYEVGKFVAGDYEGQEFYLFMFQWDGPAPTSLYRMTVEENGDWTLFTEYSDGWDGWAIESHGDLFENRDDMAIPQYDYPDTVVDEENNMKFNRRNFHLTRKAKDFAKTNLFTDEVAGPLYMANNPSSCTYATLPDGLIELYDYTAPFYGSEGEVEGLFGHNSGYKVDVTWEDGSKATGYYNHGRHYPMTPCLMVANDDMYLAELNGSEIGTTSTGDKVYKPPYKGHESVQNMYNEFFGYMDEDSEDYMTLEEFYNNTHAQFFWVDPYGNIVEFRDAKYAPMAEMGKPVIYLYPEEVTQVSVEVEPTHGISVSDPDYGEGWTVVAYPDGELVNLDDGEVYPYLFWEGLSLDYVMPEEGFVVAQGEVESFLEEALGDLGLNEGETADFMEFWYPRFEGAPYYFVTFMPQEDFEELAPLTVEPAPDTVIRVYMDFLPLAAPVDVVEPELSAPARDGFTVIEWGGALHK